MSAVGSILETFDPTFRFISNKQKKEKKERKKDRRQRAELKKRLDAKQNREGRSLLSGGDNFDARPDSGSLLG